MVQPLQTMARAGRQQRDCVVLCGGDSHSDLSAVAAGKNKLLPASLDTARSTMEKCASSCTNWGWPQHTTPAEPADWGP